MGRIRLLVALTVAVTAMMLVPATATASAVSKTACTGTLDSGKYRKLTVPAGATCDGTAAKIRVRSGVRVARGATFILGSEDLKTENTGKIRGGIEANSPASLQVHFAHVNGGLRMRGGNGYFSTVEDNTIRGGARIKGYTGVWLGFIRNRVHGKVALANNVMDDPDANEYVTNVIFGDLVCHRNSPAPQVGDSQGQANRVTGRKVGQCAGL